VRSARAAAANRERQDEKGARVGRRCRRYCDLARRLEFAGQGRRCGADRGGQIRRRRGHGGRNRVGQGRGSDHHDHGLHRRRRQLLFPAAAQALSFETAKGEIDLAATHRLDLALRPIGDF